MHDIDLSLKTDIVPLNPDLTDSNVPRCHYQNQRFYISSWTPPDRKTKVPKVIIPDKLNGDDTQIEIKMVEVPVSQLPPYTGCRNCKHNKYNLICDFYIPAKKY